jgi:hypothetical protein
MVRNNNGDCYLKSDSASTFTIKDDPSFTSYILCSTPPPMGNVCGKVYTNTDVAGGNLPGSGTETKSMKQCLKLCRYSKDGCNAAIRSNEGFCYLKRVDVSTVELVPSRLTSYLFCPKDGKKEHDEHDEKEGGKHNKKWDDKDGKKWGKNEMHTDK